ncbi:amino acid ABC transporter ATP-binding/permease protein [Gordonia sinesedis]
MWRALRLLRGRPALILAAGVLVGVIADASAVGLLGASGWFVVSCALAGAQRGSTFSYVTPSAVVRSLALIRIVARYGQRLLVHSATLAWLVRLRVRLFRDLAGLPLPVLAGHRRGAALDRAMRDVDTLDGWVATGIAPFVTTTAVAVGGVIVVAAVAPATGVVLAIGVVAVAVVAIVGGARVPDPATARIAARSQVVAVTEAMPELISLGAADVARTTSTRLLDDFEDETATRVELTARIAARTDVLSGLCLLAMIVVGLQSPGAGSGAPDIAELALVVLVGAGTLQLVEALRDCAIATGEARNAARRLQPDSPTAPVDGQRRHRPDRGDLVDVAAPLADGRTIDLSVPGGAALVLSGRSGSGKTTLLRRLAGESSSDAADSGDPITVGGHRIADLAPGVVVYVSHDEPLLAGTVGDNLRLGAPKLTDGQARALLDDLGLADVALDETVGAGGSRVLSGGEQRRLGLARALAASPMVLIADEPTDGLDADTARKVLTVIRSRLPDAALVAAVHDRDLPAVGWADTRWVSLDPVRD